jgi:hypothetical protein
MAADLNELIDAYQAQENLHRTEGRRGVEQLCQLTRALGYRDSQYFGQLTSKASLGDLVMFLEDNPGAIEALHEWIRDQRSPEFVAALLTELPPSDSEDGQSEDEE